MTDLGPVVLTIVIAIYILFYYITKKKKIDCMHESSLAVLLGIAFAAFTRFIILPPIIMFAAKNVKQELFLKNFFYIIFLGAVGTIINFIAIFSFISALSYIFELFPTIKNSECLLLAATLTATDTVSVLNILNERKYPKLHSIIFGEGIFNDAIAILLFKTIHIMIKTEGENLDLLSWKVISHLLSGFGVLTLESLAIGVILGFLLSFMARVMKVDAQHSVIEISLILVFAYLSYLVPELLQASGIMSLFSFIIVINNYGLKGMTHKTHLGIDLILNTLNFIAEAFAFIYLGIASFNEIMNHYHSKSSKKLDSSLHILFTVLLFCSLMVVRFIAVGIPGYIFCFKPKNKLNVKDISILWYAGLIRGSIAFALCVSISSPNDVAIKRVILMITLFTTLVLGSLAERYKKYIRLDKKNEVNEINLFSRETTLVDSVLFTAGSESEEKDQEDGYFKASVVKGLKRLNADFLAPVFGKERDDEVRKTIDDLKADVARSIQQYEAKDELEEVAAENDDDSDE